MTNLCNNKLIFAIHKLGVLDLKNDMQRYASKIAHMEKQPNKNRKKRYLSIINGINYCNNNIAKIISSVVGIPSGEVFP